MSPGSGALTSLALKGRNAWVYRRLRQLLDELPGDAEQAPEEMIAWTVCPSVAFHVHGLLSLALRDSSLARTH